MILAIFLFPLFIYSQSASTTVGCQNNYCNYDGFTNFVSISLQLVKSTPRLETSEEKDEDREYLVTLTSVIPQGDYYFRHTGKFYDQNKIGSVCNSHDLYIVRTEVNFGCGNKHFNIDFSSVNEKKTVNVYFDGECSNYYDFSLKNTCVAINNMAQIEQRILEIEHEEKKVTNSDPVTIGLDNISNSNVTNSGYSNSNSNNGSDQNSETTNQTSNTANNQQLTQKQLDEQFITQQNANRAAYDVKIANQTTDNNFQKNYETGQQIGTVVEGLNDLFKPTPEQIQRDEEERIRKKNEEAQQFERLNLYGQKFYIEKQKYLSTAEKGDEPTRIYLIKTLLKYEYLCVCDLEYDLPQMENWMQDQTKNEYLDVITLIGNRATVGYGYIFNKSEGLQMLEKAAMDSTHLTKSYLGVTHEMISDELAKEKNLKNYKGVYIYLVDKNSAAEEAGLQVGDVLAKVGNTEITRPSELINQLGLFHPGDKISITFYRDGIEKVVTATLKNRAIDQRRVDIMVDLAKFYNIKDHIYGGNDSEKALYWFTKAAENGSPNAMHTLGNIYLHGNTRQTFPRFYVKYKVKKNEEISFNWFLKSISDPTYKPYLPLYKSDPLFRFRSINPGSYFEVKSYDEVINMYKKGIGCTKSEIKANEIINLQTEFTKSIFEEALKEVEK